MVVADFGLQHISLHYVMESGPSTAYWRELHLPYIFVK